MRVALIAPPFIPVPPPLYGGTELFIAQLALGLKAQGIDVVVYTNGESTIDVEKRWLYDKSRWPIKGEVYDNLEAMNHGAWAMHDAAQDCDLIHLNNLPSLACVRFVTQPCVYTVHHPHEPDLTRFYDFYPEVQFVTISDFQRSKETMPRMHTILHGIDMRAYASRTRKQRYLSFLGRIAPIKGVHLAIQVAQRTGIPLKIGGEVQPIFRDYFENQIKPHVDGKLIEYVGECDLAQKNELLGDSMAMLFPIQWDEPFGLVMVEAMACGTPVIALPGGSVPEIVREGVSGHICASVDQMVDCVQHLSIPPQRVRAYVEQHFSTERMTADHLQLYSELLAQRDSSRREPAVA